MSEIYPSECLMYRSIGHIPDPRHYQIQGQQSSSTAKLPEASSASPSGSLQLKPEKNKGPTVQQTPSRTQSSKETMVNDPQKEIKAMANRSPPINSDKVSTYSHTALDEAIEEARNI